MVFKVGYWDIRGLVEPIHLLLEYLEVEYEAKKYTGDNKEAWTEQDKKNLGLDFANLPYLIDGDFKLCQSSAIMKYIGRKHGMFGAGGSNELVSREEEIMETITDVRMGFAILCYMPLPDFEGRRKKYLEENIPVKFQMFNKWLSGRKWLMGDKMSVGDFMMWSMLDVNECLEPTVLQPYEHLARFKKDFEDIPQMKKFFSSEKFKKYPINGAMAMWGGKETRD